jgi:hypothetical protein
MRKEDLHEQRGRAVQYCVVIMRKKDLHEHREKADEDC